MSGFEILTATSLVSKYLVNYLWCTSKLSFQARFPEIFDQILQNTPVLEFGSRTPSPPHHRNEILPRVQVWPYPEHPPPGKLKTLIFFPESKTDLTQNTPTPTPPGTWSRSIWRIMTVSPEDTISLAFCNDFKSYKVCHIWRKFWTKDSSQLWWILWMENRTRSMKCLRY